MGLHANIMLFLNYRYSALNYNLSSVSGFMIGTYETGLGILLSIMDTLLNTNFLSDEILCLYEDLLTTNNLGFSVCGLSVYSVC